MGPESRKYDTYRFGHYALIIQVLAQAFHDFHLFLVCQARDGSFHDAADTNFIDGNKTVIIHVRKGSHYELAIHAIGHTAMSWYAIAKIFDLEGSLESGCEETAKRSNQGCEGCKNCDVELHRRNQESVVDLGPRGKLIRLCYEDWVGLAL